MAKLGYRILRFTNVNVFLIAALKYQHSCTGMEYLLWKVAKGMACELFSGESFSREFVEIRLKMGFNEFLNTR